MMTGKQATSKNDQLRTQILEGLKSLSGQPRLLNLDELAKSLNAGARASADRDLFSCARRDFDVLWQLHESICTRILNSKSRVVAMQLLRDSLMETELTADQQQSVLDNSRHLRFEFNSALRRRISEPCDVDAPTENRRYLFSPQQLEDLIEKHLHADVYGEILGVQRGIAKDPKSSNLFDLSGRDTDYQSLVKGGFSSIRILSSDPCILNISRARLGSRSANKDIYECYQADQQGITDYFKDAREGDLYIRPDHDVILARRELERAAFDVAYDLLVHLTSYLKPGGVLLSEHVAATEAQNSLHALLKATAPEIELVDALPRFLENRVRALSDLTLQRHQASLKLVCRGEDGLRLMCEFASLHAPADNRPSLTRIAQYLRTKCQLSDGSYELNHEVDYLAAFRIKEPLQVPLYSRVSTSKSKSSSGLGKLKTPKIQVARESRDPAKSVCEPLDLTSLLQSNHAEKPGLNPPDRYLVFNPRPIRFTDPLLRDDAELLNRYHKSLELYKGALCSVWPIQRAVIRSLRMDRPNGDSLINRRQLAGWQKLRKRELESLTLGLERVESRSLSILRAKGPEDRNWHKQLVFNQSALRHMQLPTPMWEAFHLWLKKIQTEILRKIERDPRQASKIEHRYQRAFGHSVTEIRGVLLKADKRLSQIIGCRDAMVSKYRYVARARARIVSSLYDMDLDSSVSIAEAGLLKALDTFYPNHKNGFSSFAYAVVTNDLLRAKGGRSRIYRDLKHELNRLSQERAKRLNDQDILDYLIDERSIPENQAKHWLLKLRSSVKERLGRVYDLGLNVAARPAPESDLDDLNLSLGILGKLPDSEWRAISALYDSGLGVDERGALVVDHTRVGSKQIRSGARLVRTDHTISSHEQVGRVLGATKQALSYREQSAREQLPKLADGDLRKREVFRVVHGEPLGGLGIDPRYLKALYGFSISTVEDLCNKTQQELQSINGLGPHAVRLIEDSLQAFGYRLKKA